MWLIDNKRRMDNHEALKAVRELRTITRVVKKTHPHAFHVTTTVTSLDKRITSSADAQIDSGCTRSLIDRSFAKKLGLTVQSLALPLEVEGCNNTILDHIDGKVEVRLRIGDHEEARTLWTMNLVDDASILLGYDWLTFHNPTIEWDKGTCTFNRCPSHCLSRWPRKKTVSISWKRTTTSMPWTLKAT